MVSHVALYRILSADRFSEQSAQIQRMSICEVADDFQGVEIAYFRAKRQRIEQALNSAQWLETEILLPMICVKPWCWRKRMAWGLVDRAQHRRAWQQDQREGVLARLSEIPYS